MVQRYKDDNGYTLEGREAEIQLEDEVDGVIYEELIDVVHFKSKDDLARFNPLKNEYWKPSLDIEAILQKKKAKGENHHPTRSTRGVRFFHEIGIPPDTISDSEFYR